MASRRASQAGAERLLTFESYGPISLAMASISRLVVQIFCCGVIYSGFATAEVFKSVDSNGRVTYSNTPSKNAEKIELEPLNTITAPKRKPGATPADFPKVDNETQRKRDDLRRKILVDELANEQKQLAEAKKALLEGEAVRLGNERNYQKYLDRVQQLKDKVTQHEKNVQALQKELGNL